MFAPRLLNPTKIAAVRRSVKHNIAQPERVRPRTHHWPDATAIYICHTDAQGNVVAISDASGRVIEKIKYDVYGRLTDFQYWNGTDYTVATKTDGFVTAATYYTGSLTKNPRLFQGRDLDTESGLYYFRSRQYDPLHGRFLTRDPAGDGPNLYAFVNNNPVCYTDPMGLVVIRISGKPSDKKGILYGKPGQEGTKYEVPLYPATVEDDNGKVLYTYLVTRDTADDTAAKDDRTPDERKGNYKVNHETPAGKYTGWVRPPSDKIKSEHICITTDTGKQEGNFDVQGNGHRSWILIHGGPAQSLGCFVGQGDNANLKEQGTQAEFMKAVKNQITAEKNDPAKYASITIIVEAR